MSLRRREFIAGFGGAAVWPLAARAQQQKPIIGWLHTPPGVQLRSTIDAFRQGLAEIGFLEGRDVTVDYQTAEDISNSCRRWPLIWYAEGWR